MAVIPIRVSGSDANGVSFVEDAVTVSVSEEGACISLTHSLLVRDTIVVLNKQNNREGAFCVVESCHQVIGQRREWGLELVNPDTNLWRASLAATAEAVQPKALIECAGCRTPMEIALCEVEFKAFLTAGFIQRHCRKCGEMTKWKPCSSINHPEMITTSGPISSRERRAHRIRLTMRFSLRNGRGLADIAQTRDISSGGLCFFSLKAFQAGDDVFVTLPFDWTPIETRGKIVWSALTRSGRYFGVEYAKS